ncbi:hypothetical protein EJB05_12335, partial [Eragrostis curvula]
MTMANWSTLPADLLRRVGDCLLATSDIDFYMDMRAVCHDWRTATVDPRADSAAAVDPRFRPRLWVMLDEESKADGDDARLFVSLSTGCFLRRRVPLLRDNVLVAATSDGLLVIGERKYPHAAGVLNPFTGSLLRFAAPIPSKGRVIAAVADYDPTLLFVFDIGSRSYGGEVTCADPTSECFFEEYINPLRFDLASIVSHAGHVYMADELTGEVVRSAGTGELFPDGELSLQIEAGVPPRVEGTPIWVPGSYTCLVDSASELLLVRRIPQWAQTVMEVFRVDVERKTLEPVKNIGGRALFIGERCLSVETNMFPSIDSNCIYYSTGLQPLGDAMYRHDLMDGKEEKISGVLMPNSDSYNARPFSLVQVLLTYCSVLPDVQAQLQRIHKELGWKVNSELNHFLEDMVLQRICRDDFL